MTWELYEVWGKDNDGHEELVETTKSLKQAQIIAKRSLDSFVESVVYQETEDGDIVEIERLTMDNSGAIISVQVNKQEQSEWRKQQPNLV